MKLITPVAFQGFYTLFWNGESFWRVEGEISTRGAKGEKVQEIKGHSLEDKADLALLARLDTEPFAFKRKDFSCYNDIVDYGGANAVLFCDVELWARTEENFEKAKQTSFEETRDFIIENIRPIAGTVGYRRDVDGVQTNVSVDM